MKQCKLCKEELPLDYFYYNKSMKDKHLNYCIECYHEKYNGRFNTKENKQYRLKHKIDDKLNKFIKRVEYQRYQMTELQVLEMIHYYLMYFQPFELKFTDNDELNEDVLIDLFVKLKKKNNLNNARKDKMQNM